MRTQFPTSLDQSEINEYLRYLIVVGGIFVIVALFLYMTVIAAIIASKKWKRFSSERIMKYHELHRKKGHIIFIVITILVFFLVVEAVIFGLVENSRLHGHVVQIAQRPPSIISPVAQVVLNVNQTVGNTRNALDQSILLIENVLASVAEIEDAIAFVYASILNVQKQFIEIEDRFYDATSTLSNTQGNIDRLLTYQDEGYINGVPDTSAVQSVNDTIDSTISTANDFLNNTINTVTNVLNNVNTTIADAVSTGNTQVAKAKVTLHDQIASVQGRIGKAVDSLKKPNATITSLSHTAIKYGDLIENVLIVVFVFALIPLVLVFIGLVAKVPVLYKIAFAASFVFMFWLIALGGVFAVVHTAFSQACDSREVLVINGIHKFTPDQYIVNLGNINIGGTPKKNSSDNSTREDSKVIIPLNSTTLHNLLTCSNPTNLFDVFNLESLIDFIFGQIYASLDKLQEQQAEFFDSNTTSEYLNLNLHTQIDSTNTGVSGFSNATNNLVGGSYLDNFYSLRGNMANISRQATTLEIRANDTVTTALSNVNNVTRNVTTESGDTYSYVYTLGNITQLDPDSYPFNQTTQKFQRDLKSVQTTFVDATKNQDTIIQKVKSIANSADAVLGDIDKFEAYLKNTLNVSIDVNGTIDGIQKELDFVSALVPQIFKNITAAIDSIRNALQQVGNSLRADTQCGFAGEFFTSFSNEICTTAKSNAQAMCAALLIMGIAYFFVCVLGIGLLKRHDVHKLMQITQKGIQKIASMRVINRTISMVNTLVRSTSGILRRSGSSTRNMSTSSSMSSSKEHLDASTADPLPVENNRYSRSTVKFAEEPYKAVEGPSAHMPRIASALRNATHRRTASLTDRTLAQAQEIPYTELEEFSAPNSPNVIASPEMEIDKSGEINNDINKDINEDNNK